MTKKEEPKSDKWYSLTLGTSFKPHHPPLPRFSTLRYEFKPASIDMSQPGTLHKSKDNKINVEFHNNQPGKPNLKFEGACEDHKDSDAVLFFDGHGFRLERLHRSVKRLRHVRLPGESTSAAAVAASSAVLDSASPPLGRQGKSQPPVLSSRGVAPPPQQQQQQQQLPPPPPLPPVSVEVERIDIGDAGSSGGKSENEKPVDILPPQPDATVSPDSKDFDLEAMLNADDDDVDVVDDAVGPDKNAAEENTFHTGIDINLPHQNDTDDEIADVDVNDDNGVMGGNAAAALRAQVHKEETQERTSSSSASSGSESSASSSGSGSGSSRSSSDSESSDGDSVNSI